MKHLLMLLCFVPLFLWGQVKTYIPTIYYESKEKPALGNEPTVAINPKDKDDIWVAYNTSAVIHSLDGGKHWLPISTHSTHGFYGDPVMKVGSNGQVYLAHLAKNKEKNYPQWFDCIVFERSANGVEFSSTAIGANGTKMQDKPWFTIDETSKSRFKGNIYVTWTEFDAYGSSLPSDSSRIRFARSEDDGGSFSAAVTISDKSGSAKDNDETAEGATIAVLNTGEILCFWAKKDTLWMDRSADAGVTWGKDVPICRLNGSWDIENISGLMRTNGMPFAVADEKNRVYVAFSCNSPYKDLEVYYVFSSDGGKSFSDPISAVDKWAQPSDQFCPFLSYDPTNKRVSLVWHDKRNTETGLFCDLYTSCLDRGKPSLNQKISPEPLVLPGKSEFMGDYIGLSSIDQRSVAVATSYAFEHRAAAITVYDYPSKLKKSEVSKHPFIQINPNLGTDSILICAAFPGETSFTFEIKSGSKSLINMVFENFKDDVYPFKEFYLRKSRFEPGLYTFIIRRKGHVVKKLVWMD